MKLKLLVFILVSVFCLKGFSQNDPLKEKKKTPGQNASDEQKLTGKGKADFEKAKTELRRISNASFEVAANSEVMNVEDKKSLTGVPGGTPDEGEADKQNGENKKKEKEISAKLQTDRKVSNTSFDAGGKSGTKSPSSSTTGVGASWTDASYFSWAEQSPVKNQGGCGSCWAFAAAAATEHTYRKFYGATIDLSEQDIVACATTNCGSQDAGSCGGGWSDRALSYIYCHGIASEASYPYTATSGPCMAKPVYKKLYTWGSCYWNNTYRKEWIKYYITIYGAVTTYMRAGLSTFFSYSGGAYNGYPNTSPGDIDHAVTIVGWYDPWNSWIIKNSWGTGWGYGGYAYVRYDNCNIGFYNYFSYPYF